jgi:hypothetical protein
MNGDRRLIVDRGQLEPLGAAYAGNDVPLSEASKANEANSRSHLLRPFVGADIDVRP